METGSELDQDMLLSTLPLKELNKTVNVFSSKKEFEIQQQKLAPQHTWSRVDVIQIGSRLWGIKKGLKLVKIRQKTPILGAKLSVSARPWSRVYVEKRVV